MAAATQAQFTYINKINGDYATITLPCIYGKLKPDVVEDRQLLYKRLASIFGDDFVESCKLVNCIYRNI